MDVKIHYIRPNEPSQCRDGKTIGDPDAKGNAVFQYGELPGAENTSFRTLGRPFDAMGKPDTWHMASACPFKAAAPAPAPKPAPAPPAAPAPAPPKAPSA